MLNINNFYNTKDIKRFYQPTKIFFGKNSKSLIFDLCVKNKIILLLVTKSFSKDPFIKQINKAYKNTVLLLLHGEPKTSFINETLNNIPKKIDYIIAIGGGSVIDSAKAIYAKKIYGSYKRLGYGEKRFIKPITNHHKITLIALPTTAGSGSEVSRYYLISDEKTKEKTVSRSWLICPEYAILDPYFLKKASKKILILGAFDAFIHLLETYISRFEQSMFTDILILDGIPRILKTMDKILLNIKLNDDDYLNLQFASTLAGISISNVRTGFIHDVGEAISAETDLSHPETLFVFFESIMNLYDHRFFKKKILLINKLNKEQIKLKSFKDIGVFWRKVFERENLITNIKNKLNSSRINKDFILMKVMSDKVLVTKESPVKLNEKNIKLIISKSLKLLNS